MPPESALGTFGWLAPRLLFLFGLGFLVANLRIAYDLLQYRRRRPTALLVWPAPKPKFYGLNLALGVVFGGLIALKLFVLRRPLEQLFGEAMMCLYYGYALPFSTRIARGFYEQGVWADAGFVRWTKISAVSWREGATVTLMLVSHASGRAQALEVPGTVYGAARRLLRDRIAAHDIHIEGTGLALGMRDERDVV
jgi:hypothetical protein